MSEPIRNPQIPAERYDQFVAAAITGILANRATITPAALAKSAHAFATAAVQEDNYRNLHAREGYPNLY